MPGKNSVVSTGMETKTGSSQEAIKAGCHDKGKTKTACSAGNERKCLCPVCNYSQPRSPGEICSLNNCPVCGINMVMV
jgi:hypothetical protein